MDHTELEQARWRCDPLADDVVAWLAANRPTKGTRDILDACRNACSDSPECNAFIAFYEQTPNWLESDEKALHLGQQLWWRNGIVALLVGFTQLIDSYAGGRDNTVLVMSGQLARTHAFRRLVETAVFAFDCASPGALQPGGHARNAIARVRLLHAEVRRRCMARNYDTASYQEPVNQEAMAGTLMLFSAGVIKALAKVGLGSSHAERESYHKLWRLVGHLIGVERSLLPTTYADELQLYDSIKSHSLIPNEITRTLFESAVVGLQMGAASLPWYVWLAGGGLLASRSFLEQLTVALCDENISSLCGLHPSWPWQAGIRFVVFFLRAYDLCSGLLPRLRMMQLSFSTAVIKRLLSKEVLLKGKAVTFSDPGFHEESKGRLKRGVRKLSMVLKLSKKRKTEFAEENDHRTGAVAASTLPHGSMLILVTAGVAVLGATLCALLGAFQSISSHLATLTTIIAASVGLKFFFYVNPSATVANNVQELSRCYSGNPNRYVSRIGNHPQGSSHCPFACESVKSEGKEAGCPWLQMNSMGEASTQARCTSRHKQI